MAQRPKDEQETHVEASKTKYDLDMATAVLKWIDGVLTDTNIASTPGPDEVHDQLKDGIILCRLMNSLEPGSIKNVNKGKASFPMMENIGYFNEQCRQYGVQPDYLFVTTDLFERQNMAQVLICLRALGTLATKRGVEPAITI